jgi:hypothetical protein
MPRDARQIIDEIGKSALTIQHAKVSGAQLGQLAAAIEAVLRDDVGIAKHADREAIRKGIQALAAGLDKLESSKQLAPNITIAMISRWCDWNDPYVPTDAARVEIPILLRELALRKVQMEMEP